MRTRVSPEGSGRNVRSTKADAFRAAKLRPKDMNHQGGTEVQAYDSKEVQKRVLSRRKNQADASILLY